MDDDFLLTDFHQHFAAAPDKDIWRAFQGWAYSRNIRGKALRDLWLKFLRANPEYARSYYAPDSAAAARLKQFMEMIFSADLRQLKAKSGAAADH